jgi:TolA-binding protein
LKITDLNGATKMKYNAIFLSFILVFACSGKLTEQEYYTKAKEAYTVMKFDVAIHNFKELVQYYPDGEHSAEAMFMLGFIYANDLKQFDLAKEYYGQFVKKYPNHDLADDAKYELETLGKDINDLPMFKNLSSDSLSENKNN